MAEWKKVVLDGAAASLASLTLTTDLSVANGGTGASSHTSGEVLIGNGAGAITTTTIGIADNNIVEIDDADVASGDYAKFTANGLEGRDASEVLDDISAAARGANSDITSLSGLTTALSVAQGGTGLTSLGTAGADALGLDFGSASQVLKMNAAGDGLEFADSAGDITKVETAANSGLDGGADSGDVSLSLDVDNLTEASIDAGNASTYLAFADGTALNAPTRKESIGDFITAVAGKLAGTVTTTGLSDSSGVLSLDIANMTALGGATIDGADEFAFSDAGSLKKVTFSNLEDSIFANVSGDATVAAGGSLTIAANSIEGGASGGMLNDNVITNQTVISDDVATDDEVLIYDSSATRIRKASVSQILAGAPQGDITGVTAGTGLNGGGAGPGAVTLNLDTTLSSVTAMTGVNSINASGNGLALGATDSDVTVNGNLIVKGTASFEEATSLKVKDQVIVLGSGSAGAQDGGFVVEQSGGDTGQFFGYDSSAGTSGGRFGVKANVAENATSVDLVDFVTTVSMSAGAAAGAPSYGGDTGYGAFAVDTSNEDIYVYMPSS